MSKSWDSVLCIDEERDKQTQREYIYTAKDASCRREKVMGGQIESKFDHCVRTWSFESKREKDNKAVCRVMAYKRGMIFGRRKQETRRSKRVILYVSVCHIQSIAEEERRELGNGRNI